MERPFELGLERHDTAGDREYGDERAGHQTEPEMDVEEQRTQAHDGPR